MALDARNPELEDAIRANPYDLTAYSVYADWLQRHGDPRGELITMQLIADDEAASTKRRTAARRAAGRHIAEHKEYLLGPLARRITKIGGRSTGPFQWRAGYIHRAGIDANAHGNPGALTQDLFAHPSGRFVAELAIRAHNQPVCDGLIDAVAGAPVTLRRLRLFARANLGDLGAVWPALGRATHVAIIARTYELGAVALPAVKHVQLAAMTISPAFAASLGAAAWPSIERFDLRIASLPWSRHERATFADLRRLLERGDLTGLTHLRLRGLPYLTDLLRELPAFPIASQLVVLDLCEGMLDDPERDLRALGEHKARFPRLRELWLPQALITPEYLALLDGLNVIGAARAAFDATAHDFGAIIQRYE